MKPQDHLSRAAVAFGHLLDAVGTASRPQEDPARVEHISAVMDEELAAYAEQRRHMSEDDATRLLAEHGHPDPAEGGP